MNEGGIETVLIVCDDADSSNDILERLHHSGHRAVGPAHRAATALALTAQSAPTVALVAGALGGRRSAYELAEDLMATWGVPSLICDIDARQAQVRASEASSDDCAATKLGRALDIVLGV